MHLAENSRCQKVFQIINNIEHGTPIALRLYKHSMRLLCAFCHFECSLLHNRLYETAERAHTRADMHTLPSHEPYRLPGSLRSSHSAKLDFPCGETDGGVSPSD